MQWKRRCWQRRVMGERARQGRKESVPSDSRVGGCNGELGVGGCQGKRVRPKGHEPVGVPIALEMQWVKQLVGGWVK